MMFGHHKNMNRCLSYPQIFLIFYISFVLCTFCSEGSERSDAWTRITASDINQSFMRNEIPITESLNWNLQSNNTLNFKGMSALCVTEGHSLWACVCFLLLLEWLLKAFSAACLRSSRMSSSEASSAFFSHLVFMQKHSSHSETHALVLQTDLLRSDFSHVFYNLFFNP